MDCVHHWKIETPNGGRWSAGSCIRCGESRQFRNSSPEGEPPEKSLAKGTGRTWGHRKAVTPEIDAGVQGR